MKLPQGASPISPGSTRSSLLGRVQADDQQAWAGLVDLYGPLVYYWCRRSGLSAEDAADVFQEVFRALAVGIKTFRKDANRGSFRGYLRVITAHKIADHFREKNKGPVAAGGSDAQQAFTQVPDPLVATDDGAEITQGHHLLHRAVDVVRGEFEERTWQAFWRSVMEGHDTERIVRDLRMSASSVYQARSRVLRRLREELGDVLDFYE